jgi:hypothetical protein
MDHVDNRPPLFKTTLAISRCANTCVLLIDVLPAAAWKAHPFR